jgi:hypothetical protein
MINPALQEILNVTDESNRTLDQNLTIINEITFLMNQVYDFFQSLNAIRGLKIEFLSS